ncbi:hypothetical protein BC831DRAFT_552450 [Entophlyctis helioformis]|nr:hypothetical protein BC831DRAFT_552450 [Entophlyctis helioformis]
MFVGDSDVDQDSVGGLFGDLVGTVAAAAVSVAASSQAASRDNLASLGGAASSLPASSRPSPLAATPSVPSSRPRSATRVAFGAAPGKQPPTSASQGSPSMSRAASGILASSPSMPLDSGGLRRDNSFLRSGSGLPSMPPPSLKRSGSTQDTVPRVVIFEDADSVPSAARPSPQDPSSMAGEQGLDTASPAYIAPSSMMGRRKSMRPPALPSSPSSEGLAKLAGADSSQQPAAAQQQDFTTIRTDKIINQPTTFAVALSKASFYDKIIGAMGDGLDEHVAFTRAVRTTPLVTAEAESQVRDTKTGIQNLSAHILDGQDEVAGPKRLDTSRTPFNFAQRRSRAYSAASSSLASSPSSPMMGGGHGPRLTAIDGHAIGSDGRVSSLGSTDMASIGQLSAGNQRSSTASISDGVGDGRRPSVMGVARGIGGLTTAQFESAEATAAAAAAAIQADVQHTAHAADETMTKLRTLIEKLHGLSNGNPSAMTAADFSDEPAEFVRIKQTHQRIMLIMNDYDTVSESIGWARERMIKETFRLTLESSVDKIRSQLKAEYEKKINHDQCLAKIASLTKDCSFIKDESNRLTETTTKLTAEVNELRLYKSNAEAEHRIMIEELARRRLKQRMTRRRLKMVLAKLHEAEDALQQQSNSGQAKEVDGADRSVSEASQPRLQRQQTSLVPHAPASRQPSVQGTSQSPRKDRIGSAGSRSSRRTGDTQSLRGIDEQSITTDDRTQSTRSGHRPFHSDPSARGGRAGSTRHGGSTLTGDEFDGLGSEVDDWLSTTDGESDYPASRTRPGSGRRRRIFGSRHERSATADGAESTDMDDTDMDVDDEADDSRDTQVPDEEIERWWQEMRARKPKWNRSTATTLLSQKCPPSVIYVPSEAETGRAAGAGADTDQQSTVSDKDAASMQTTTAHPIKASKEEMLKQLHAPCRKKRRKLVEALLAERQKQKKPIHGSASKVQAAHRLVEFLTACLSLQAAPGNADADPAHITAMSKASMHGSAMKWPQTATSAMDTLTAQQDLIREILAGIDVIPKDTLDPMVDAEMRLVISESEAEASKRHTSKPAVKPLPPPSLRPHHDLGINGREAALVPEDFARPVVPEEGVGVGKHVRGLSGRSTGLWPIAIPRGGMSGSSDTLNKPSAVDVHPTQDTGTTAAPAASPCSVHRSDQPQQAAAVIKQHEFQNVKSWVKRIAQKRPQSADAARRMSLMHPTIQVSVVQDNLPVIRGQGNSSSSSSTFGADRPTAARSRPKSAPVAGTSRSTASGPAS